MKPLFRSLYLIFFLTIIVSCKNNGKLSDDASEDQQGDTQNWSQDIDFEDKVSVFEDQNRDIWQKPDRVIDILGPLEGKTVVDLGAGTGYFAFRLIQDAAKVIAIDIDPDFIKNRFDQTIR